MTMTATISIAVTITVATTITVTMSITVAVAVATIPTVAISIASGRGGRFVVTTLIFQEFTGRKIGRLHATVADNVSPTLARLVTL